MCKWWQTTTIYQIYPRSFMDSNGDGIGDLEGIISRLDYLKDLGVETIWVSPFYSSAQQDHGYDISDYEHVDPIFGQDEVANRLIKEVHQRGMKIVFDMVMNHTSIMHRWFQESRSSTDNPKRNWYIWRKGKGKNRPPNNWMSMTGKKGWNYDERTDEWYYASFLNFQPDLNYKNPEVVAAMFKVIRYWLEKGVDGFRLDIFNCIGKDEQFEDNPFSWRYFPTPDNNHACFFQEKRFNYNHPDSFDFAKKLRAVVDEYPNRFLIGEVSGTDDVLKTFLGNAFDGLHTVFLFELIHFKYSKTYFKHFLEKIENQYPEPYVPTYVLSNHDIGRFINRLGGDMEKAKCIALFQLTNRGIPIIYYGDEIGMLNHDLPVKSAQDPLAKQYKWAPKFMARWADIFLNRDDCRTPMQWSAGHHAGFTSGERPWLPLSPEYETRNVASQQGDTYSLFNTYRGILGLRQTSPALLVGKTQMIPSPNAVLAYSRYTENDYLVIVIHFGSKAVSFSCGDRPLTCIYQSSPDIVVVGNQMTLPPNSGIILRGEVTHILQYNDDL